MDFLCVLFAVYFTSDSVGDEGDNNKYQSDTKHDDRNIHKHCAKETGGEFNCGGNYRNRDRYDRQKGRNAETDEEIKRSDYECGEAAGAAECAEAVFQLLHGGATSPHAR